jgi:hypothetical protein
MATPSTLSELSSLLRPQKKSGEVHVALLNGHDISMICTKCKGNMEILDNRNTKCKVQDGGRRTHRNKRTRRTLRIRR